MGALSARVKRLYESLRTSREHLKAEEEERSASRRGTHPIGALTSRQRARVSGVLQAVTYRSSQDKPILVVSSMTVPAASTWCGGADGASPASSRAPI